MLRLLIGGIGLIVITMTGACGSKPFIRPPMTDKLTVQPTAPFSHPLPGARLLSPFGQRGRRFHTGIDLQHSRRGGELVLASRGGKVVAASSFRGYGITVMILHPDGFRTRYAHLKQVKVRTGQKVKVNQSIGTVGRTGRATTPHLHFEILTPEGKFTDPLKLMK